MKIYHSPTPNFLFDTVTCQPSETGDILVYMKIESCISVAQFLVYCECYYDCIVFLSDFESFRKTDDGWKSIRYFGYKKPTPTIKLQTTYKELTLNSFL